MTSRPFPEQFALEIECWHYGVANYPGEIHAAIIHNVLKEIAVLWHEAVLQLHAFDIVTVSQDFSKAGKFCIGEREVAFAILALLPHPFQLNEDQQFTLGMIIDQVEQAYGGAIERMEKRWKAVKASQANQKRAA